MSIFIEESGLLCVEAENGLVTSTTGNQRIFAGDGSVGSYITGFDNGLREWNDAGATRSVFTARISTAGEYTFWARTRRNGVDDTLYFGRDAGSSEEISHSTFGREGNSDNWGWSKAVFAGVQTLNLPIGEIDLRIHLRERPDIDRVLLTTDSSYDPSLVNGGLGPAESSVERVASYRRRRSRKFIQGVF